MEEAMFMKLTTTTKVSSTTKRKTIGEGARKKNFVWPGIFDVWFRCSVLCNSDGSYSAGEDAFVDMM
jgi:hypothetical protein